MIRVKKRDGRLEALDVEKIHKVLTFACHGLRKVSVSDIALKSQIQFHEGITTEEIQRIIIQAAVMLIDKEHPDYQYVAGRLLNYNIRKEVYGQYDAERFDVYVEKMVKEGLYSPDIIEKYTADEIREMCSIIDHSRDSQFSYAAMEQWVSKYLVKNRVNGKLYESPQMAYMMIAATLFINYPTETRMTYVKRMYDAISKFYISLPTPIMGGLRTNVKQFSSCVTINVGDDLDSIAVGSHAIIRYVSRKAGIGINLGRIRAVGSPIRGGDAVHTGLLPFVQLIESSVKSCSQGGLRGGAATVHFPCWHYEFENLVVLKNNKGVDLNRARRLDYCFQFNGYLYQRFLDNKDITLFSPNDVPELLTAFYSSDLDKFAQVYEMYEADESIRKKTIPASELFSTFIMERTQTGRIYLQNIDHVNSHTMFDHTVAPIEQSNLCQEIALPTVPLTDINGAKDERGMISLCTLAGINWGRFDTPDEMEQYCDIIVRALDELLDYQDYPIDAAERATKKYRPLGVGIINFAYFLAKRGLKYDDDALSTVHEWAEAWAYYLNKTSVELAKEKGSCDMSHLNKTLIIDTYKKTVDELVPNKLVCDWESLRNDFNTYGIRNATLTALMPSETSSQILNATNGIEKPRSLVSLKQSKDGTLKQVVPEIETLADKYSLLWEQTDNFGYLKICAVLQKFIDQSISANTSHNIIHYIDDKIPMSLLMKEILVAYKYGIKNLYYENVNDNSSDQQKPVLNGADKIAMFIKRSNYNPSDKKETVQQPQESVFMQHDEDSCDSCTL